MQVLNRIFHNLLICALLWASLAFGQTTNPTSRPTSQPVWELPAGPLHTATLLVERGGIRGAHASGIGVDDTTIHTGLNHVGLRVRNGHWATIERLSLWSGYNHPYPPIWQYLNPAAFATGPDVDGRPHTGIAIDDQPDSASYGIILDRVQTYGYGVGLGIGLNGRDGWSSEITVRDSSFQKGRIGVAVAKSQSRNVRLSNLSIGHVHAAFDSRSYGLGRGAGPWIEGGNWSMVGRWFNHNGHGGIKAVNLYGEAVLSLGILADPKAKAFHPPANFVNCEVYIGPLGGEEGLGSEWNPATAPRNAMVEHCGDFSWNGGGIYSRYRQSINNSGFVTFRDCQLQWFTPVKGERFITAALKSKLRLERVRFWYGDKTYEVTAGGWDKVPVAE